MKNQRAETPLSSIRVLTPPTLYASTFAGQEQYLDEEDLDDDSIVEWMCCQCAKFTVGSHRFDCTRCSHDMCPYCERKRRRDVREEAPPTPTTPTAYSSLHAKIHFA